MGRPSISLVGQRFRSFVVIGPPQRDSTNTHANSLHPSLCDCGAIQMMRREHLNRTNRDGCTACLGGSRSTHRMSKTSTYATWCRMKLRCLDVDNPNYPNYGGRGITICERWLQSFDNFLADMGEKPSAELSIDRINNNGNYEPTNCRWATSLQQARNRRPYRKNRP